MGVLIHSLILNEAERSVFFEANDMLFAWGEKQTMVYVLVNGSDEPHSEMYSGLCSQFCRRSIACFFLPTKSSSRI